MHLQSTRKRFLVHAAGAGAVVVTGGFAGPRTSPAESRRPRPGHSKPRPLTPAETATLVAWCEVLVPGARAGRVGDFVNAQLAKPPDDALIILRYFTWPPPFLDFYRGGLAALETSSMTTFGQPFLELTDEQRGDLLGRLLSGAASWEGPPFFLVYLATRNDAVDVVYGTPEGYARLGAPYVPQVPPPAPWWSP